jgi:hypothetical protein
MDIGAGKRISAIVDGAAIQGVHIDAFGTLSGEASQKAVLM